MPQGECAQIPPFPQTKTQILIELKLFQTGLRSVVNGDLFKKSLYGDENGVSDAMPNIQLRQTRIAGETYHLRSSFVVPSFTGTTDQLSTPMELIARGVPLWVIVKVFGHDEMF
ncbi:MAG TPA: hypothetical protein PLY87_05555 [Planctomycetaceae bacterium]|nr:hypothetical protein [Planctomycetaceae bacterium]HQZ64517.1 hypothetical protein [Planctomycetaceae bacterium]